MALRIFLFFSLACCQAFAVDTPAQPLTKKSVGMKDEKPSFMVKMMMNLAEKKVPNQPLIQLAWGALMQDKDAADVRESLEKDPDNLTLRLKLAGYVALVDAVGSVSSDPEGDANSLWIIAKHPELQMPMLWGQLRPRSDGARKEALKLWDSHVATTTSADVLCSAADYLLQTDAAKSQDLLEKAAKMDPKSDYVKMEKKNQDDLFKANHALDANGHLTPYEWKGKAAQILKSTKPGFEGAPLIHVGPEDARKVVVGKVKNSDALSGDLRLHIDHGSLNILADVREDHAPFNREESNQLHQGDSVEIWISGKPEISHARRFQTAPDDYYIILAPSSKAGKPSFRIDRVRSEGVELSVSSTANGYSLNASIPLANFAGQEWKAGKQYRFECAINKGSKAGQRDAKLFWNSVSDDAWRYPDMWGLAEIK